MEVSRGGWPSVGQGLGDLDLLCPGISRGRRGEQSTLLLQSRGVLGTATSASSAGLTPQRKGSPPLQPGRQSSQGVIIPVGAGMGHAV